MSTTYSYSKLNTFSICPQQYKIIYIDKIRKSDESIEAYMGKRVHEVLEWLYSIKELEHEFITFDKIIKKYKEFWLNNFHENIFIARIKYNKNTYNKDCVYQIGIDCLKNYYNRFQSNGYFNQNVIETEFKFKIKIGAYNFIGYIDRIDKNKDGSIDIIDYKTNKKSKSYYQAKNDFQLAIYYLAVKKIFKKVNKINLNFFYLRTNEIIHLEAEDSKISELENKIKRNVYDINNETDFLAKESILCEWCYLWNECEVKSTTNPALKVL